MLKHINKLDALRLLEKNKYDMIYASNEQKYKSYGHTNHGKGAISLLVKENIKSLIDVGCGHNQFCNLANSKNISAIGVDSSCPSADILAHSHKLPFENKSVDCVTAFDVLEHLLMDEIKESLDEFYRISKKWFIFSISYRDSYARAINGESLHPTIMPEKWWIKKLTPYGIISKYKEYIMVRLQDFL